MENASFWLTPLLLLPGVALLILSTSTRYGRLHDEFHHLEQQQRPAAAAVTENLFFRARYFRNALISLYSSVTLLSLAGLIGGFTVLWSNISYWLVVLMTCLSILGVIYASWQLILESRCSLAIVKMHHDAIRRR